MGGDDDHPRRRRARSRSRSRSRERERSRRSRSHSPHRRAPSPRLPLPPPPPAAPGDAPPPPLNSIHRARVVSVRPFGVFVALPGHRRHALVPPHQVAAGVSFSRDDGDDDKVRALNYFARQGETVWAKVIGLAPDDRGGGGVKISASLRCVDQSSGADADPDGALAAERPGGGGDARGGDRDRGGRPARGPPGDAPPTPDPPAVGAVLRARVARVAPYGVHVWVEGYTGTALVHASQVSDHPVVDRDAADGDKVAALAACVPAVGDLCYVKVVAVEPGDPPRVSASLKLADQRGGGDLDPHGLKWRPGGGGGGSGGPGGGGRAPVGAAAGGAVAGDAVEWGHLAAETYGGGGQQYDLVVGDDDDDGTDGADGAARGGRPSRSTTPVITSVEEALAILEKYGGGRRRRGKKEPKKERKERRSRRSRSR